MDNDNLKRSLETLNAPQRAAVTAPDGPMLVIAGAGSGKTRVLTMRIAYLLAKGVKPYNILALTFTNKAADEMKERIARIVGGDARQLWMGTFHSVFAKILRFEAERLGISSDFSIYDAEDSRRLVDNVVKQMNLDDRSGYKPKLVAGTISAAKNDLILPAAYADDKGIAERDKAAQRPKMPQIYARYVEECRKAGALDFDDLLLYTNILLRDCPDVLAKYQDKFQHILVDEYQDTNLSQYVIINRLAKARRNICVVGDDAQSIYSFRGARIENILNFRRDYPQAAMFKLEQNYRSTRNIVGAANSLIAHNRNQIAKNVFSAGAEGDKVRVWACDSDKAEAAEAVADVVRRKAVGDKHFADFAILYRASSLSRAFEEKMVEAGVPYRIFGGVAFYQRKEVKDALAYLRLVVNHNDVEAMRRVINYPKRQIGGATIAKVEAAAQSLGASLWDVMTVASLRGKIGVADSVLAKIERFTGLIETLTQQAETLDAYQLAVEMLTQSGLLAELSKERGDEEGKERFANVQELLNGVKEFTEAQREDGEPADVRAYLQQVSLRVDLDDNAADDKVNVMTIHASKGLEFDCVYVVGVEDEIFPGHSALDPHSLEEERRLLYVALTRAKQVATVSYAKRRFANGRVVFTTPSRFVAEFDEKFCSVPREERAVADSFGCPWGGGGGFRREERSFGGVPPVRRATPPQQALRRVTSRIVTTSDVPAESRTQTADGRYHVGDRISHDRFGAGTIEEILGGDDDVKLRIAFDTNGEKTLLLKFARINTI